MVKYFKAYTLQADENSKIADGVGGIDGIELEQLMAEFDPMQDRTDAILLSMLTGEDLEQVLRDWVEPPDDGNDSPCNELTEVGSDRKKSQVDDFTIQGGDGTPDGDPLL
mmetsp:Transcript_25944/g.34757  ORF Transcript_25944/g.34757 Transcript_25944/m.34757 type:complete len:110 (-) Transcript_25944:53-382(-)|eukprot:CAMPEP_0185569264 /NCGR_PEP_ID=MMETSP0434-20130131/1937_1 /TAXON_ID=626734 ORGANISM="Favella taraikaensis, Strain Fe Narragansett Bay" /NCGR_SAMPLE_ID=MMETSP0434 /ASSEMBLY_ACC=CAM_ASM_000379 /LENGTH=109 /DNA_ID=CAMNT_0028183993 /DNA_START=1446 /DNA_END=1775 /DNA_ORIENTATION=-